MHFFNLMSMKLFTNKLGASDLEHGEFNGPSAKLVILQRPSQSGDRVALQSAWKGKLGLQALALKSELGFVRYAQVHAVGLGHPLVFLIRLTRSRPVAFLVSLTAPEKGYKTGVKSTSILALEERWCVIHEFWWPSVDAMFTATTSQRGLDALSRLRELLASHSGFTAVLLCRERIVAAPRKESSNTARTGFFLRLRSQDIPVQMQNYWEENHAPLVQSLTEKLNFDQYDRAPAIIDDSRTNEVIHALGGEQALPYLGIASLSYPTIKDLILGFFRPKSQFANFKLMQDELAFIDPPACPPFLGTRFPIG